MNVTKSTTIELSDDELQALAEGEGLRVPLEDQVLVLQPPRSRMEGEHGE